MRLFEFSNQPWFPVVWRGYITDLLRYQVEYFQLYAAAEDLLRYALARSGAVHIVDLCSGSGGPILQIAERLGVPVTLTDLYPPAHPPDAGTDSAPRADGILEDCAAHRGPEAGKRALHSR